MVFKRQRQSRAAAKCGSAPASHLGGTLPALGLGSGLELQGFYHDLFDLNRKQIAALAETRKLPIIAGWSEYAHAGCLMTYGVNFSDLFRRAAWYVDRIVKGTSPGDLPIAQPEKFELIINLKTAKALGIQIPPVLLATADETIE